MKSEIIAGMLLGISGVRVARFIEKKRMLKSKQEQSTHPDIKKKANK